MQLETYKYDIIGVKQYRFVSKGRKDIIKLVQFKPTRDPDIINLGFGDELPDGTIDDKSISDNGDIIKVLATVVKIAFDFTGEFPDKIISFTGSTPERTKLYYRILAMYFNEFSENFLISGGVDRNGLMIEVDFDPKLSEEYLVYFVKRKL
jgi:hypothetical protein